MSTQPILEKTHHFTTEREGWVPYFKENMGLSGLPLHDVLVKAGLDFQTLKVGTFYKLPGSDIILPSQAFSVIRADNGLELGKGFSGDYDSEGNITDAGYHVVQHEEALGQIFQDVMNLETAAHCVSAIGFNNGAKVAITFRLPDQYQIRPGDNAGMYLNFFNSFDGSDGVGASWFELRPVCQNTFRLARKDGKNGYFTRHTRNVNERLMINAAEILGLARREFEENAKVMQLFAKTPASDELVKAFLHEMHPDTKTTNQGPANRREFLYQAIANGPMTDPNNLTIYDLLAGQTMITTWKRTESRQDNSVQFEYAQTGTGAGQNMEAYNFLRKALG